MAFKCSACGVAINRKYGYCWKDEQAYLRARQRACADCKAALPKGRAPKRCTGCQRLYVQRLAKRAGRVCMCGAKIARGYTRKACRLCRNDELREYRARKRGR